MVKNQKPIDYGKAILKAAKSGDFDTVKELLAIDAGLVETRDKDGSTPLHCACWKGFYQVAELLLEHGADVNARNLNDHWGDTPLHAAAHGDQRAIAELLISRGANISARNLNGRTPLEETSFHNAKPVATLLKQHGATE